MAEIIFEVLDGTLGSPNVTNGSGLGFYGSTFGASVPTTDYQSSTWITDADGVTSAGQARNVKYIDAGAISNPSAATGCILTIPIQTGLLIAVNSNQATLNIHFKHTVPVNVRNCQLRIWDRTSIDNPASGVITKVAEIANFGDKAFATWQSSPGNPFVAAASGYGDAFWWGAPWPSGSTYGYVDSTNLSYRPYYQNSVGVKFYNFTDYQNARGTGNLHPSISGLTTPGYETVGGSGIIVPLLDSPGASGRFLKKENTANILPKFIHYTHPTYQGAASPDGLGLTTTYNSGTTNYLGYAYGGTGVDTMHSWRVAMSAKPLSIGSKKQYALYVSLEYL